MVHIGHVTINKINDIIIIPLIQHTHTKVDELDTYLMKFVRPFFNDKQQNDYVTTENFPDLYSLARQITGFEIY